MSRTKPPAKAISKAREGARRHHRTAGEKRAVAPRPLVAPTKKRPAGETSLTRNVQLQKPAAPPPRRAESPKKD